jgi:hypothetical protein
MQIECKIKEFEIIHKMKVLNIGLEKRNFVRKHMNLVEMDFGT